MTEEARLLPLRDAYLFEELGQQQAAWGNVTTPNPPVGATFTYIVGQAPDGDAKLVLTIADDAGRQVRRLDVTKTAGLNRITWNLRGEAAAAEGRGGGRGGRSPRRRWWPRAAIGRRSGGRAATRSRRLEARRRSRSFRFRGS